MFYEFNQNNSGGRFDFNEEKGLTHIVIIEAVDKEEAEYKAGRIGIYFNGCDTGRDCSCCGDRWGDLSYEEGSEAPMHYGEPIAAAKFGMRWMKPGKEACVHYADGRKEWF